MSVAHLPDAIERAVGPGAMEGAAQDKPHPFASIAALCPVGAFDSGMGGLSVIAELRRLLPHEDIIYYGDNAHCPYGERPDEWLRERSAWITAFLLSRGAKTVVVACNAASAAGLEHLRAIYPLPIVGLVPAVKPAVESTRTGVVGVLATQAAIRGRLLADVIDRFATPAGVEVVKVAPEGWVEAVERGDLDTPQTEESVRRFLAPMLERNADAIVFGCTHYPFLYSIVRKVIGDRIRLIDSGDGVSRQTARVLASHGLLYPGERKGKLTVYTSADPDIMRPLVWRLVGEQVQVLGDTPTPNPLIP
ncbi:MAG: glutamate racemase [Chloroflexia bacterium]